LLGLHNFPLEGSVLFFVNFTLAELLVDLLLSSFKAVELFPAVFNGLGQEFLRWANKSLVLRRAEHPIFYLTPK
jgi:flagellar biosynthesis protein FliR